MFAFRDTCDLGPGSARVEVAFTDASTDFQSMGPGFGDALTALESEAGVTFARMHQVHRDAVHVVTRVPAPGAHDPADWPEADALVTARRDVGLMVRVADCVPVLLADPEAGVVAAVHAGRNGVALDVVGRAVAQMRALGATAVRGWIGPHVCGRCYEVPEAMRDEVASAVPATHAQTRWGTPALDLGAGVMTQLRGADVIAETVPGCTLEDEQFHSHRRDGAAAGRLAGLVWSS